MKLSLVVIVANGGCADEIMEVIKLDGARGGTIINGNSSVSTNTEKLYGISIHKEKDCILVIVDSNIKNKILKSVYDLNQAHNLGAIAFSMPISDASENLLKQYSPEEE